MTVKLVPDPVYVFPPGVLVNVQVPEDGKPFSTTLPEVVAQLGWVIVPTSGAAGMANTVKSLVPIQPLLFLV